MSTNEEYKIAEEGTCCLCEEPYSHYGNNPEPVVPFETGRCCDWCNANLVIPLRIKRVTRSLAKHS